MRGFRSHLLPRCSVYSDIQPRVLLVLLAIIIVGGHPHLGTSGDACPFIPNDGVPAESAAWLQRLDTVSAQPPPTKVGFGSCSNPKFPQPLWKQVMVSKKIKEGQMLTLMA